MKTWRPYRLGMGTLLLMTAGMLLPASTGRADDEGVTEKKPTVSGREIFAREWMPDDPRSHGGDGLGPVFNDTSCIACHNQGGAGGGGPREKNVDIVTASPLNQQQAFIPQPTTPTTLPGVLGRIFDNITGQQAIQARQVTMAERQRAAEEQLKKERVKLHPGFANANSVVLHHFGTEKRYEVFRNKLLGVNQNFPGGVMGFDTRFVPQVMSGDIAVEFMDAPAQVTVESIQLSNPGVGVAQQIPNVEADLAPADSAEGSSGEGPAVAQPPVQAEPTPAAEPLRAVINGILVNQLTQPKRGFDQPAESQPAHQPIDFQLIQQANQEMAMLQQEVQRRQAGLVRTSFQNNHSLVVSQRNATAIFGAGLIDSIPDQALVELANKKHNEWPNVSGRVAWLKDGRAGKFGWKNQTASLYDFTMTACAVELGLHVPDHPQSGLPHDPKYQPTGLDLNQEECDALVEYLKELPAPVKRVPSSKVERDYLDGGEQLFTKVGCAACHTPNVGEVTAIYSDLLLHDLGPSLGDIGDYGVFVQESPGSQQPEIPPITDADDPNAKKDTRSATRLEWRTPPLWGLRDSAPYLHDGRARTIEEAIALHGGEGTDSARKYFMLSRKERLQVQAFLKSMTAPETVASQK